MKNILIVSDDFFTDLGNAMWRINTNYTVIKCTDFKNYDFRKVSTSSQSYYRFTDDVTKEVKDGRFIEVPISSYHRGFICKVYDKLFRKLFVTNWKEYYKKR